MLLKKYKIVPGEKYIRLKIKTNGRRQLCSGCKYLMRANNKTTCNYYNLCLGLIRFGNIMFSCCSYVYHPT